MDEIDVMESESDEAPRQLVIPSQQKQPTHNLPTLEAMINKYQSTLAPVQEEP